MPHHNHRLTHTDLMELDNAFISYLNDKAPDVANVLNEYRLNANTWTGLQVSEGILMIGPYLESFMANYFAIEPEVARAQATTLENDPIFAFKKYYVLREAKRALRNISEPQALAPDNLDELQMAKYGQDLLKNPEQNKQKIDELIEWCVWAMATDEGQAHVKDWVSFTLPKKLDYDNLVPSKKTKHHDVTCLEAEAASLRQRDGFALTDHRMSEREALSEIHYCVYCHEQEGDFCSKGFPVKKNKPELGLKEGHLQEVLTGCPLEEKISEMHVLKKNGLSIAALATIMVDNPMCPATGHRICNDCMKGCIYQKQEPVNIPQVETRVLTDVLDLPWGVEIYDLLTRWNPLRHEQYIEKKYNGKKILIMGMGPAGFTLAHHLLMEGFAVVGVDGLKIEKLPTEFIDKPIKDFNSIKENLNDRVMAGFGGVAEYGITVRWDKNFLKLIYITLARRHYFQVFGCVRFGGTITVQDAWYLGFDHLAVAVGAGLPRELHVKNSLAPGMRQANDFLMALQLTGAAKKNSLANLQVRLPAVVIGGGLTGVDTATEVQAYYIVQVEKALARFEKMSPSHDSFTEHEWEILQEFIEHGKQVRAERELAKKQNREPDFIKLIRQFGGVTIAYRRRMQDSPAYRRNHEELTKALEEGIFYAEGLQPTGVELDEHGFAKGLFCDDKNNDTIYLPARSIFVATGAKPNVAYAFEHPGQLLKKDQQYLRFNLVDDELAETTETGHCKMPNFGPFTNYDRENKKVTFLGDTHPIFHGSVVKAIASAKRIYPEIVKSFALKQRHLGEQKEYHYFRDQMQSMFCSYIKDITRLSKDLVEVTVHAAMPAKNFQPGQFIRLQNFERDAEIKNNTLLQTEAMALLGIPDAADQNSLKLMVLERGASSRLVSRFKKNQAVALMGPTGVKAKIPDGGETVCLIGGTMAVAELRALSPALKAMGNTVMFVHTMKASSDLLLQDEIEACADHVLWLNEIGESVKCRRDQDQSMTGELIVCLRDYDLLKTVDRVIVTGATNVIQRIQTARSGMLENNFKNDTKFFASVYGAMQCMLKGVCAQCLQWQIDPVTGERTKAVYACSWQEQPMEKIDIHNIDERLSQNRMQEKLTDLWLEYLLL